MKRRGEWTNSKCPRCNHEVETTFHVLQCRDQGSKRQWNKSTESLKTWFTNSKTLKEIQNAILNGMCYLRQKGENGKWNWSFGEYYDRGVL